MLVLWLPLLALLLHCSRISLTPPPLPVLGSPGFFPGSLFVLFNSFTVIKRRRKMGDKSTNLERTINTSDATFLAVYTLCPIYISLSRNANGAQRAPKMKQKMKWIWWKWSVPYWTGYRQNWKPHKVVKLKRYTAMNVGAAACRFDSMWSRRGGVLVARCERHKLCNFLDVAMSGVWLKTVQVVFCTIRYVYVVTNILATVTTYNTERTLRTIHLFCCIHA